MNIKWTKLPSTRRYDHSTKKWYDTFCTFVTVYGTTKIQVWQEPDCSWSFSAGVKRSKVGQFQTAKAAKRAAKTTAQIIEFNKLLTKTYLPSYTLNSYQINIENLEPTMQYKSYDDSVPLIFKEVTNE